MIWQQLLVAFNNAALVCRHPRKILFFPWIRRFLSRQPDYQSTIASKTLIPWNRLYLHSMYHSVRVTLHRPYLLRQSITGRFRYSHDACISSACADVAMRVNYLQQSLHDRPKLEPGASSFVQQRASFGNYCCQRSTFGSM